MEKRKSSILIRFILRAILGLVVIFGVNQFLDYRNIPVSVGINLIDIRNPWNSWGLSAVWHYVLSNYVSVVQKHFNFPKLLDKKSGRGYNTPHKRVTTIKKSFYAVSVLQALASKECRGIPQHAISA